MKQLSCGHTTIRDLTQGLGEERNYYCSTCKMHYYKGREWTAKEWEEYVEGMIVGGIVIGKSYVDGWGQVHTIGGVTKERDDWYYTLGGNWFDWQGRKVWYLESEGHIICKHSLYDLKEVYVEEHTA